MDNDHIELGETGFISTDYGFLNVITGEKFDHEGNIIESKDNGVTKDD